jgi:hypothetical protein
LSAPANLSGARLPGRSASTWSSWLRWPASRSSGGNRNFRSQPDCGNAVVDGLRDLVNRPAPSAGVCPAYIPLVLDVAFTPILRFVWLTSLFETGGVFERLNLNTDQCGVSFGILQWSQKAGQLHRILHAFFSRGPDEWANIMFDQTILDYTAKTNGGVDERGQAIDPAFELTHDPWRMKLQMLGASLPMQRVQLEVALEIYSAELARETAYAASDTSERGFAFILDLANQFGPARVEEQ